MYEIIGLPNIGNTCYINSVTQCLLHLSSFKSFIQTYELEKLFDTSKYNQYISNLSKILPSHFEIYQQNDVHEFYTYLIDFIYELQKVQHTIKKPESINTPYSKMEFKCRTKWFESYSPIMDVLYTQLVRQIQCVYCNHFTINIENVSSIDINLSSSNLDECVNTYFNNVNVENWKCDLCQKVNKKPLVLQKCWHLPNTLVLCIKRFKFIKNKPMKINTHIDVPYTIDLESHSLKIYSDYRYRLSGIVNHSGTSYYGHYTCDLIKSQNLLIHIDDDDVKGITNKSIQNKNCYILFFTKDSL